MFGVNEIIKFSLAMSNVQHSIEKLGVPVPEILDREVKRAVEVGHKAAEIKRKRRNDGSRPSYD